MIVSDPYYLVLHEWICQNARYWTVQRQTLRILTKLDKRDWSNHPVVSELLDVNN